MLWNLVRPVRCWRLTQHRFPINFFYQKWLIIQYFDIGNNFVNCTAIIITSYFLEKRLHYYLVHCIMIHLNSIDVKTIKLSTKTKAG